ncbi:hypothetical protein IQ266_20375 [filamentous cyanobacterium LEGE 11480]|uniref:Uncharacterized protein n=1 Tax=Romeriopsis navalis LEGE 11480 TaxID=2777977 RepID=A0A928VNY5_9CYAN|nr:hypothetical protein [Romeriopsis navalis]MBE9032098.1 hypothetical protein [Romeriopsis navalis LEGE 11480]
MTLPQNEPNSKGVSAGLRSALAALLVFYWLGYEVHASIFWGALAGVAMGRIVYWLELKDEPAPDLIYDEDSLEEVAIDRRRQKKVYARHHRQRRKNPVTALGLDRLAFWKR